MVAPDSVDPERLLDELLRLDEVEAAELNRAFRLHHLPDDPLVGSQWALSRIRAFDAWEVERGKAEVLIAVIDSGIDYTHPDLVGSLYVHAGEDVNGNGMVDAADFNGVDDDRNGFVDDVRGWDFTDAPNYPSGGDYLERDNDPMDEMGHGTAVAGLIAAAADNHIGIAGLAPGCRILNLRSMNAARLWGGGRCRLGDSLRSEPESRGDQHELGRHLCHPIARRCGALCRIAERGPGGLGRQFELRPDSLSLRL
jgi:subtilisin family serine protease